MEFKQATPLPEVCRSCTDRKQCLAHGEPEWCCDECDYLMERFIPIPAQKEPPGAVQHSPRRLT